MVGERTLAAKRVALERTTAPNAHRVVWRLLVEGAQQGAAIRSEHFPILTKNGPELDRGQQCTLRIDDSHICLGRPLENPSFNPVFGYESQLFVERSALRSSVQLHRGHFSLIEILDRLFEQLRSNAPTPVFRVHQDHAN